MEELENDYGLWARRIVDLVVLVAKVLIWNRRGASECGYRPFGGRDCGEVRVCMWV